MKPPAEKPPAVRRDPVSGRFIAGSDLRTRFAQIADVLVSVDAATPARVSTRAFDGALRDGVAVYESLPRAKNLCVWLGMSWPQVKEVALDERRNQVQSYRSRNRTQARPWTDVIGAVAAVRRVAEALNQDHLTATDFDAFRAKASRATQSVLPTTAQIVRLHGSWEIVIQLAGLQQASYANIDGMPVVEAIGVFVETQGRLPGRRELERFAADPRWAFRLGRISAKTWPEWLAEFDAWWVQVLHKTPPAGVRHGAAVIPLTPAVIDRLPLRTGAPRGYWTRERAVQSVMTYLVENPSVASIRQPAYRAWAKKQNAKGSIAASPSTLTKHGTLEELELEARERLLQQWSE